MAGLLDRIRQVESGGLLTAKNPRSSAYGPDQFLNSTWLDVMRRMRPDLASSMSQSDLLALRSDPKISGAARDFYVNNDITPRLTGAGFQATPGNTYLGYFLGPQGAVQALKADPTARVADLFPNIIEPNSAIKFGGKSFSDFTVADLRNWADTKMGGAATTAVASASAPANATAQAPIYSPDLMTSFQRAGNAILPGLISAPEPMTPAQITQYQADLGQAQAFNAAGSLGNILTKMGAPPPEEPIVEPPAQMQRRKFAGIPLMRGLL